MNDIAIKEGELVIRDARIALLVSRFNGFVVESLLAGALDTLKRHGADERDLQIVRVPGAFEMPVVAQRLAASKRFDALIALGAVIRGGTPHFDFVCSGVTDGVREVMRDTGIPVAFGVLTTDDLDSALARAGGSEGNKGAEAALAAIEMARLVRALEKPPDAR